MANNRNGSNTTQADLNLYLGLSLSPLSMARDLRSDLSLSMPDPFDLSDSESVHSANAYHPFDEIPIPTISGLRPGLEAEPIIELENGPQSRATSENLRQEVRALVQQELLQYPEYRFQRLFESNRRSGVRRTEPSSHRNCDTSNSGVDPATDPERLMLEILNSERFLRANGKGKRKGRDEDRAADGADFECNICLDVAREPVVTVCGHLFCWPCLYRWLHLYHQECPLCKGEVTESNVVPIYGRGAFYNIKEKNVGDGGGLGLSSLKIPPRPHGSRVVSQRQQLELQMPMFRRLQEGIANSWRRFLEEVRPIGARSEDRQDLGGEATQNIPTPTLQRVQREVGNPQSMVQNGDMDLARDSMESLEINSSGSPFHDGSGPRNRSSLVYGRAITDRVGAEIGRMVRTFRGNRAGISASISNPQNTELRLNLPSMVANLASASSTMAVTQGEIMNSHDPEPVSVQPSMTADPSSASSTIAVVQGDIVGPQDPMLLLNEPSISASSTVAVIQGDITNSHEHEPILIQPLIDDNRASASTTMAVIQGDPNNPCVPQLLHSEDAMDVDQASASSTMAVILGDTSVTDAVMESTRRQRRNWMADPWAVDTVHHPRRRRRLN